MNRRVPLRRPRAWLLSGALLLVQVALAAPPITPIAQAAKRKKTKGKKKAAAAEAQPEANNDDILSITSGALGESGDGGGGGADPALDPESGLEGPGASHGSKPAPPGGPAPDAQVALVKPRTRRVAVPPYVGNSSESLRQAVLEVLTEHADLEVVGSADITMVEKRLKLTAREPASWPRLAQELSLYALVVGDGDASRVRVIDPRGRTVGTLTLDPKQRLDMQARARLWAELGRYLSDEGLRQHQVAVLRASAEGVLRGQGEELFRQREIAERRAKLRQQLLLAATERAGSRLAAQNAELARQASLAQERIRQQQIAAAKAAEEQRQQQLALQRQQEMAAKQQQAALAAQQQQQQQQQQMGAAPGYGTPAAGYAAPASPYPAQGGYGYAPQGAYGAQPAYPAPAYGGYGAQPAHPAPAPAQSGYGAQPAYPAPAQPAYPPASGGYSNRGGYVPQSQRPPPAAEAPPADQAPPQ